MLTVITEFKWTETDSGIGMDLAARSNGVGVVCGANSCADLRPSTINFDGNGGSVDEQILWCNDTSSIECENPVLVTEDSYVQTAMTLALQFEQDEAAGVDFLKAMHLKVRCRVALFSASGPCQLSFGTAMQEFSVVPHVSFFGPDRAVVADESRPALTTRTRLLHREPNAGR